ncbi:MAG TPA: fused MFS/spermidine synthase [Pyrinomonadaceae bacterium]|nr:fused MFS/spermidine synthase [Pyrinomonadaceae bacterium]
MQPATSAHVRSYSPSTILLIGVCFVFSGATGLIYEVLWARMLGLVFGATTLAVSTVLAAFMGGLALGSAVAGRLGHRIRKPFSTYGWMEIGIAVYALLVPVMFRWVDSLYAWIWQQFQPGFFTFSLWRFVLSCLMLLVPTTLMGATLPVLSAAVVRHSSTAVTRLYACNLVGAIVGTLAAGFVLLPSFGVRTTILIAAVINVIVGVVAIGLQRQTIMPVVQEPAIVDTDKNRFWFFAALASGFVTISTQVSWTRILTMVIGSSTYAFSIVVALFLIGLAGGAWFIGRKDRSANLLRTLSLVEAVTAVSLFASLYVVNRLPWLLFKLGLNLNISSWAALLSLQILCATLLVLVPALLMGMVMPVVLAWATADPEKGVARVGRAYAINTIGAIAGAFLTGFVLIPRTSTKFALLLSAAVCVVVAGFAYRPGEGKRDPALKRSLAIGAIPVVLIIMVVLTPRMNLQDFSIGAYDTLVRVIAQTREGGTTDQANGSDIRQLLMYEEGPTATVSVRRDNDTISMAINGRTNASDSMFDMPTQVMLGQLPLFVAPRIEKGLVIGFATGITVGSMLQSPIQSVTCLELEPGTVNGSRFFEHVNNLPLADPRTRLIIDDARTYLRVTPERFDLIVSEPSHPWVPGVANLFTEEFFELGKSRLNDQGVFVQWVQIYQLSTESLRSVLATYQKVFPHVLMFRVGGLNKGKDLLLFGSNQPLNLDRLSERLTDSRVQKEIARVNLSTEADVRSWFVCDETRLRPAVAGAKINTDDNMHIETTVPREAFRPLMQSNAQWVESLAMPPK